MLEDIDLHGARGILVNITAGPDLSIGEFNDVGATVQEFASQDATIVVGTSIDMELTDELRVTVVAAGLEGRQAKAAGRETTKRSDGSDYRQRPQVTLRQQSAAPKIEPQEVAKQQPEKQRTPQELDDYLDIPAFLRRQAD